MRLRQAAQVGYDARDPSVGASEACRVRMLGGFRVSVGERSIAESEWRLKKAAGLVKLLALAPQHRLHREQIVDVLWPDLAPKAAANNLRYALHNARRILGHTPSTATWCLPLRNSLLALCPSGELWVDAECFEEAAKTARYVRSLPAYEAAVGLYSGDLLPEDRYAVWAEERRKDLRGTYLALLLELAGLYEEQGDLRSATEALRRAVSSEPTHEGAHTQLMRLYAVCGFQSKALLQYEQLRQALSREFGTEPDVAIQHVYKEVLRGRFSTTKSLAVASSRVKSAAASQHNLPATRTSFVGRERELAEIKQALEITRLLTLTGACGLGKTRLALEVARELKGSYPGGVWLVELATISEEVLVPQAVAATLGVQEQPYRPLSAALVDALRQEKTLLVLDNCEHLVDAVASVVNILLDSCPQLRILATSREALGVTGEVKWLVPPLSLPDPQHPPALKDLAGFESVRLFVERARQHHPAFVLAPGNVGAVVDICGQLEGIPLAVELAAARVGVLSLRQIATRLEDSLRLLISGGRMASPRQRTLRGALDWSYGLLREPERRMFNRLSAFAGGWTLEAAEVVTGDGIDEDDVLDLLSRLMDKSLIVAEADAQDALRYRMLKPIKQYGWERLKESGEADAVRLRHATWCLKLAEEAELELRGVQQEAWLKRLEREYGNLRAALSWALGGGEAELGLQLSGALGEYWYVRGYLSEGRRWLEVALAKGNVRPVPRLVSGRAKALARAGRVASAQGDYEHSIALSEESLTLSRELGDAAGAAAALSNLGWAALFQNRCGRASKLAEEAIALQRASGDTGGLARALLILGMAAAAEHGHERAAALHEESLALARKVGDNFAIILSLALGAFAFLGFKDYGRARDLCAEGLESSRQLKMRQLTTTHLHLSAALAGSQGQPVRSARLWGAAEALREDIGAIFSPVERHSYRPYIVAARAQLGEAAWGAAWAEGKAMTLERVIDYASSKEWVVRPPAPTPKKPPDELTRREQEVATLIARGLTNRQIAAEMFISEHTVISHVRKIVKKLGLRYRTEIAAWAAKQLPHLSGSG